MQPYQNKPAGTLEDYWNVVWRRRWWIILPLFLGWSVVVVGGRFISPRYRSETVILVEQQRASEQYVLPNITPDVQARLQNLTQQILSRTKLVEIIGRLHLYGQSQKPTDSEALVQRMRRDIKIDLIQAPGRPGELSAFRVAYSAPTAALAQQVTNELTAFFIDENLRSRRQTSEDTTQFLEQQLEEARVALSQQDDRLREFQAKHLGELPEQVQNNVQILSGLQTRLQANTDALDEANQQQLYLQSLLSQYPGAADPGSGVDTAYINVDDQLARLKAELADLSGRYKPNHPDIRQLETKIAMLERLQNQPDADTQPSKVEGAPGEQVAHARPERRGSRPVLQLESQLTANKLRIAHLERTAKKLEKQIDDYHSRLNAAPLREQEFAEINRDHEQARASYESLRNKEAQSEMATNLEKQRQGELFSVIDPPNLPQRPYWPDWFKLNVLGLIMGTLLALGVVTLLELLDVRIYRDEDLRDLVAVPVLAAIPVLQTAVEQRRQQLRRRLEAIAVSALATFIPAVTLLAYFRG